MLQSSKLIFCDLDLQFFFPPPDLRIATTVEALEVVVVVVYTSKSASCAVPATLLLSERISEVINSIS